MEPTLQDGDLVLVRKCDAGTLLRSVSSMFTVFTTADASTTTNTVDEDREAALRYERLQGLQSGNGWLASAPPLTLPGQVLVYQNPVSEKKEFHIKRVVAVGGQWLRHEQQRSSRPDERFETTRYYYDYRLEALPGHTIFVEGDNATNSIDSRSTGPISKNLVVGVAEYIVWPPTRWGRIRRQPVSDADGKPRALWY